MEEVERKTVHVSVRERRAVALLQAQHFCQQWHLYLLNALLMPRHVCCCKLLLRPILDDEVKGAGVVAGVPWLCPGSFLMRKKKDFWQQLVCGVFLLVFFSLLFSLVVVDFFTIISSMFPLFIFSLGQCILCIPPPRK